MAIYNGKKITKANTAPLGLYRIKDLPIGEYVKRVSVCKACEGEGKYRVFGATYNGMTCDHCEGKGYTKEYPTVYIRGKYDAFNRRYPLARFDDMNRETLKSGNVIVLAGFTF